jgi:hypothetical protein
MTCIYIDVIYPTVLPVMYIFPDRVRLVSEIWCPDIYHLLWLWNIVHNCTRQEGMTWTLTTSYAKHVNDGALLVHMGPDMAPVDIGAATPDAGREQDVGWNCHNFAVGGLKAMCCCRAWRFLIAPNLIT